jgi:hypothetical protein
MTRSTSSRIVFGVMTVKIFNGRGKGRDQIRARQLNHSSTNSTHCKAGGMDLFQAE